ncbi:MAG: hypothetical protein IIZ68_04690 [Clostridia bacterium]|nr:hypothetical protein [Ruminococcus sp.]MBQ1554735.1 hypothetical protein [Clostridia bacterium]
MTTTEKLQTLLSGISQNIEVHREFHRGHGESYIVHEILTESDGEYSDDEPEAQVDTVRVHYFTKGNPTPVKKQIRRLLRENDFTIIFTEPLREADTGYHHIVIEARVIGESD